MGTRTDSRIPPRKTGIARLVAATGYSLAGLRAAYRSEEAMRMEVWTLCVAIPLAVWLAETRIEMVLLIGSAVLVMLFELVNTAIEKIVDRVGLEYHDLSRQAKDVGSSLVLISLLLGLGHSVRYR